MLQRHFRPAVKPYPASTVRFTQLAPRHETVEIEEALPELALGDHAPADRPYTIANFVSSADGHATFGGRSRALGDEGDKAMFHGLREQVDAVFAGTRTLEAENYGRILGNADRRARREQRGLPPEPLACVVTRSGAIPVEIPLFGEPEARIAVFAPPGTVHGLASCTANVTLVELKQLTLSNVMASLRSEFGVGSLLCEGGPTVFASLVREQVVDELWLTLASKLTGGGTGPSITRGAELPELQQLDPIWVLERERTLFLRYRLT
jgi:riboflavin biosynthesis pyrimidine reductase